MAMKQYIRNILFKMICEIVKIVSANVKNTKQEKFKSVLTLTYEGHSSLS